MTITATELAARVDAGASFLDGHRPGWEADIDLADLCLRDTCCCVLGQIGHRIGVGGYFGVVIFDDRFLEADGSMTCYADDGPLPRELAGVALTKCEAFDFGFDLSGGSDEDYGLLTGLWRYAITARRA